jgi:hypothetical protein
MLHNTIMNVTYNTAAPSPTSWPVSTETLGSSDGSGMPHCFLSLGAARELNNQAIVLIQMGYSVDAVSLLARSLQLAKSEVERHQGLIKLDNMNPQNHSLPMICGEENCDSFYRFVGMDMPLKKTCPQGTTSPIDRNEEDDNDSGRIFQCPMYINDLTPNMYDSVDGCTKVLFCIMYNLALAKHMISFSCDSQQDENLSLYFALHASSTSSSSSFVSPPLSSLYHQDHKSFYLRAALKLYELAYQFNTTSSSSDGIMGRIAILHNVTILHRELHNKTLEAYCREQLLRTIMVVLVMSGGGPRSEQQDATTTPTTTTFQLLERITRTILPTILMGNTSVSAPAA